MAQWLLGSAGVSGLLAVAIGAFGAHGLKAKLSPEMMAVYNTGVQYHFYHTLALLALALFVAATAPSRWLWLSGLCFIAGIVGFSGSLYWLALGGPKWLGPVTPLGGLCFMAGWLMIFVHALEKS